VRSWEGARWRSRRGSGKGLLRALALRDAHEAGGIDAATLAAEADRLDAQIGALIAGATRYAPNLAQDPWTRASAILRLPTT